MTFKTQQTLKADWERYRQHVDISPQVMQMLIAPICTESIAAMTLLPGGCANTNYKILFESHVPLVVRVYTREASSLTRERDIHRLVHDKIPTARFLFADESQGQIPYPFAIFSYVEGLLLRDLIFKGDEQAISTCCFEAGRHLATLSTFTFHEGGFFEMDLRVRPFNKKEAYLNFALSLLKSSTVKRDLGHKLLERVHAIITGVGHKYLPSNGLATLTHGDYDPSNIKVTNTNGSWHISGILDWEFAFSGTYYLDIGQMVRYSHKLQPNYEESFIAGIRAGGLKLAPTWKRFAKIMDLLCLLQLVQSNPKSRRPLLNSDVTGLISYTIDHWESF